MEMTDEKQAAIGGGSLPNLADLPLRVTREDAAALLTRYFFKTSPRTLERAPLPWRRLNGKGRHKLPQLNHRYLRTLRRLLPEQRVCRLLLLIR
jgi:hypothetical protein